MELVKPSLQALIVCDTVIEDKHTGKKSIIGAFTHIAATSFPCQHPQMGVYFCITDASGTYEFELELMYLNQDLVIGKGTLPKITVDDRLQISDFGIMLPALVLPGPGRYEVRLSAKGQVIGIKDFNVVQKPQGA